MSAGICGRQGLQQRLLPLAVFLLVVVGCASKESAPPEAVRPVKSWLVTVGEDTQVRTFPGKVEAARRVELAFQVPGLLVNFPVKEGQQVKTGDLIGQLREEEFRARLKTLQGDLDKARATLQALRTGERPEERLRREAALRAAQAKLVNARSEYDRDRRLVASRTVSREAFERSQTALQVAQEEYAAARQILEMGTMAREEDIQAKEAAVRGIEGRVVEAKLQLDDCTLRAPYDGVIAQRLVEQNQNVRAKDPVVRFQDVDEIRVAVDVPEVVMSAVLRRADIVQILAEFSAAPGLQFPMQIKEIAQKADPKTQTFTVRVGMKAPPDITLLPGMTATVTLTSRRASILGNRILVPVSAILKDGSEGQAVWVLGTDQTVARRPVKLGEATGGKIEIVQGLEPGERIAVAGVHLLREGMKVRDLGDALGGS
jgi:RND family efflux transporter MFP subunit